jgi:hypothetical protein
MKPQRMVMTMVTALSMTAVSVMSGQTKPAPPAEQHTQPQQNNTQNQQQKQTQQQTSKQGQLTERRAPQQVQQSAPFWGTPPPARSSELVIPGAKRGGTNGITNSDKGDT